MSQSSLEVRPSVDESMDEKGTWTKLAVPMGRASSHVTLNEVIFLDSATYVNLHLLVKAIVHYQAMGHSYAMWFHRVSCDIGIIANIGVVEIRNSLFSCPCRRGVGVNRRV